MTDVTRRKMKKAIYIRMPRCGSSSIVEFCANKNIKYYGGLDMGYWGKSKYKIQKNTSPHLYKCVSNYIGKKIYDESYIFSSVRNPYSRAVSMYSHLSWNHAKTFEEFCFAIKKKEYPSPCAKWHSSTLTEHIMHGNNLKVDFFIRLENLQEDFNVVCDKIGIPQQQLPHKNKSKHKYYTEYYNEETREIITKKYAKDIEYFGYEMLQV